MQKWPLKLSLWRTLLLPIALTCSITAAIFLAAEVYMNTVLNRTILASAEGYATNWTEDLADRSPLLIKVVEGEAQAVHYLDLILRTARNQRVFLFKVFGPDGRLIVSSAAPHYLGEGEDNGDRATVRQVFATGRANVSLHDGSEIADRPDSYVEIYQLMKNREGIPIGVIESYVDMTHDTAVLYGVLLDLSRLLIFGGALAYLLPSLFLIYRGGQLRRKDQKLLHMSLFDPLTDTLNRRAFTSRSHDLFTRRDKELAVMFIDLDRFKTINDQFGHDVGDKLLTHVAATMMSQLSERDVIGRIGGDEFVILCPRTGHKRCEELANRIVAHVSEPFTCDGVTLHPGLSVGMHVSPPGEDEKTAMNAADLAVYRAKHNGRGQAVMYCEDMDKALQRRRQIETCIRESLSGCDGFFVEFQPIFEARSCRVAGFEALLRLRDPEGAHISPAEFIPVAEMSGLINQIGRTSLRRVLETANSWGGDHFIAVNLSAIQFKAGDLPDIVADLLAETGFDPKRLELEVTEGILLEDEEHVSRQLAALRALGVAIALDDFGTGYSSLGYLWKYQFEKIKIDRSFVEGFDFYTEKYGQIISTIVTLGKNLDMKVTVEGVETDVQLKFLQEVGCDMIQGFLLGRPMSAEDAFDLIKEAPDILDAV